jgi:hypothetical protein
MAKPERGIPSLMMMPTPLETPVDDVTAEQGDSSAPTTAPRARRRRPPAAGAGRGHKLTLPDGVFERLELTAIRKRSTVSKVAADILDKNLPRLRIEQDA